MAIRNNNKLVLPSFSTFEFMLNQAQPQPILIKENHDTFPTVSSLDMNGSNSFSFDVDDDDDFVDYSLPVNTFYTQSIDL